MELLFLALVALINILLGAIVFISNSNRDSNKLFLALTAFFSLWTFANYWTTNTTGVELIYPVRLTIFLACFISLLVWFTIKTFPDFKLSSIKFNRLQIAFASVVAALTLTPFVFKDVAIVDGASITEVGPLVSLFAVVTIGFIGGAVVSIIKKYRNSTGLQKTQTAIILFGIGMTFLTILVTNFVLVLLFDISFFLSYTPAFSLIFSAAFAYGIFRHQMYEFRSLVIKAVSYVLSLGVVVVIPSFLAIYWLNVVLKGVDDMLRIVATTALLLILILLNVPLQKIFNKVTSRLFYRDAYDPQQLLNDLGDLLVAEVETEVIEDSALKLLDVSVRPTSSELLLIKNSGEVNKWRSVGDLLSNGNKKELEAVVTAQESTVIVTSAPMDTLESENEVIKQLKKHDINISIKLDTQQDKVGFLLLGPKKSGNQYNTQDIRFLKIMANELSVALQNAERFDEIKLFNQTLQQEINDATKELRRTNEKLKELDEAKDEFVSMASHQLRTPLTSVKGYISMMLEGDVGKLSDKQEEMLKASYASSQRMVYLISDLLNVSRLKTGKFIIDAHEVNLPDIASQEVSQLQDSAKSRGIKLVYSKPKRFPKVMLDETKTRQVMMNFIDNAIYYTPSGGRIEVTLKAKKDSIEYIVEDNGIGVPKEQQKDLFTKFFRAENAKKARPDGTGLGLFMAQKVIVAQGGAVIFKSKLDEGSTFGFTFPLAKIKAK